MRGATRRFAPARFSRLPYRLSVLRARFAQPALFAFAPCLLALSGVNAYAAPATPVTLSPAEARAALRVLEDPAQRAHVEDTLRAIAAAGALATPASGAAAVPASAASAASVAAGASAADAASAPLADALRANGLVVQMASHAASRARGLANHLLASGTALLDLSSARHWWRDRLHTPAGHALLVGLLRLLLLALVPSLAVEALARRGIRRPYRALVHYAAASSHGHLRAAGNAATDNPDDAHGVTGASAAASAARTAGATGIADTTGASGMTGRSPDASGEVDVSGASVTSGLSGTLDTLGATSAGGDLRIPGAAGITRRLRADTDDISGVAHVPDALGATGMTSVVSGIPGIPVTPGAASRARAASVSGTLDTPGSASAFPGAKTDNTPPRPASENPASTPHPWTHLQRVPIALGAALLHLLPIVAFGLCAAAILSWRTADDASLVRAVGALVDTYVICRVLLVFSTWLFAPHSAALRMLPLASHWAAFAQRWSARLVIVGGLGGALNAAVPLGMTESAHLALVKLVTLVAHLMLAAAILQCRHPVAAAIRRAVTRHGQPTYFGHWLADIWAGAAVFAVIALWLVWALDVRGGYRELVHAGGLSLVVLLVARVAAILALGALARLFEPRAGTGGVDERNAPDAPGRAAHLDANHGLHHDGRADPGIYRDYSSNDGDNPGSDHGARGRYGDGDLHGRYARMTLAQRRMYRYYPLLRRLTMLVIGLGSLDALLNVWGVHLGGLFVNASIGHRLGSALATIVVAVVAAIVLWESANIAAERRLQAWTQAGDYVRAARLRTLLPMLRTSLLVAILVVVGLTALSQLGVNVAPLVAGASIFGVALGFGSQKLVQDFITGIFLLTENAMQVGDSVTVAGVSGTVEFLSIRTVRLRGSDGSLYTVPFSSVTTVNNTNRGIGNAAVKVAIARSADLARAIDALNGIGRELRADDAFAPGILGDFAYWGIDEINGASITLVGQIPCTDTARWSVQRAFNRRVLERFAERGIELANPQRSFWVRGEEAHQRP